MRTKFFIYLAIALFFVFDQAYAQKPPRPRMLSDLLATHELTYHTIEGRAKFVVHGTVSKMSSYMRSKGPHTRMYTDLTLDIIEDMKGRENRRSITFKMLGGKVGETHVVTSHFPTFELGEEVIVFLKEYGPGSFYDEGDIVLLGEVLGKVKLSGFGDERRNAITTHIRDISQGRNVEPMLYGRDQRANKEDMSPVAAAKLLVVPSITSVGDLKRDWDASHPQSKTITDTLTITGSNFGSGTSTQRQVEVRTWDGGAGTTTNVRTYVGLGANEFFKWEDTEIKLRVLDENMASGDLRVRTPSGWSSAAQYEVIFNTWNSHAYWSDTRASNGIDYWFRITMSPSGSVTDVMWTGEDVNDAESAIDDGFTEWANVTYSDINFTDKGQTNAYGINAVDKKNVIMWTKAGADWAAYTHRTFNGAGPDTLTDVDIEMSFWFDPDGTGSESPDSLFWSTVDSPSSDPNRSSYTPKDVGDVITHEIGHLLGAGHYWSSPVDTLNTMYFSSGPRAIHRRSLEDDDKEFAKWVHPSGSPKRLLTSGEEALVPRTLYLKQNYPNPFNPQTHIEFRVLDDAEVTVEIFNALGQQIRTLLSGSLLRTGEHRLLWNSRDDNGDFVSSGIYLYRVTSNKFSMSKKMTLAR